MLAKLKYWNANIREIKVELLISISLLIIALIFKHYSGVYADQKGSASVADIVIDNIGPFDFSLIVVWFFMIVISVFMLYPIIFTPKDLPRHFTLIALFLTARSLFITLTHLKAPETILFADYPFFANSYEFSNDLFFSGHTGFPFLGFLIFKKKFIKYFMLVSSIILAASVLLMHQHYSIDVASAYFITYGIYKIGNKIFQRNN
jgi:hypothetical protein